MKNLIFLLLTVFSLQVLAQDNTVFLSPTNRNLGITKSFTVNDTAYLKGRMRFELLQGVGDRMVIASSTGYLSTQAIPTGTVSGSGTATRVAFWDGTSSLSSNANLYWDNSNSRLGLRDATPSATLDITGAGATSATYGLQVHNSTGTNNALAVRDDGFVGFGVSTPTSSDDWEFRKDENALTSLSVINQTNNTAASVGVLLRNNAGSVGMLTYPANYTATPFDNITASRALMMEFQQSQNGIIGFRNLGVTTSNTVAYAWSGRNTVSPGSDFRLMSLTNTGFVFALIVIYL